MAVKYIKSLLIWILIIPIAILNGGFRESILINMFGNVVAGVVSAIILSISIFIVAYLLIPKLGKNTKYFYVYVGVIWFTLTNLFDISFILIDGRPVTDILQLFNISSGNLWILVISTTLFSPIIVAKIRGLIR